MSNRYIPLVVNLEAEVKQLVRHLPIDLASNYTTKNYYSRQRKTVAFAKRFLKITMKNQPAAFYTHWSWIHTPLEATILHRFLICR